MTAVAASLWSAVLDEEVELGSQGKVYRMEGAK